jgi:hypothetical protein
MSEYPQDVQRAADRAFDEAGLGMFLHTASDQFPIIQALCAAIMVERGRAEKIAGTWANDLRNNDRCRFTAAKIAAAIRTQHQEK